MVSTTMNDDGLPANGKVALNEVGKNLKFMPRIYLGKKKRAPNGTHFELAKKPGGRQGQNRRASPLTTQDSILWGQFAHDYQSQFGELPSQTKAHHQVAVTVNNGPF